MSRAQTHLVYATHGCFQILEQSRDVRELFQPTDDSFSSPSICLYKVCNVISWAASLEALKDLDKDKAREARMLCVFEKGAVAGQR